MRRDYSPSRTSARFLGSTPAGCAAGSSRCTTWPARSRYAGPTAGAARRHSAAADGAQPGPARAVLGTEAPKGAVADVTHRPSRRDMLIHFTDENQVAERECGTVRIAGCVKPKVSCN